MAIIVDYSQIFLSNILSKVNRKKDNTIETEFVRDMVINSIRSYNQKHKVEFGEMIIACDSSSYWRRDVFPYYKSKRKSERDKTNLDWKMIFDLLNECKQDLIKYFPYAVVTADKAEADDVIATLANKFADSGEKVLIISGDGDFIQLQQNKLISQFDPIRKRWYKTDDAKRDLLIKIMEGDRGDGIPNIMSKDNSFADNIRMTPLSQKKKDFYLNSPNLYFDPESAFEGEVRRNFQRNKKLIDLSEIPEYIKDNILVEYDNAKAITPGYTRLRSYFMKNKMKNFMGCINDF